MAVWHAGSIPRGRYGSPVLCPESKGLPPVVVRRRGVCKLVGGVDVCGPCALNKTRGLPLAQGVHVPCFVLKHGKRCVRVRRLRRLCLKRSRCRCALWQGLVDAAGRPGPVNAQVAVSVVAAAGAPALGVWCARVCTQHHAEHERYGNDAKGGGAAGDDANGAAQLVTARRVVLARAHGGAGVDGGGLAVECAVLACRASAGAACSC